MKRRQLFPLAVLILLLVVSSCQKEVNFEAGAGQQPTELLRMKINGVQWVADQSATATIIGGYLSITGSNKNNVSLSISLTDSVPGTYQLDQQSFHGAGVSDVNDLGGEGYTTNEGKDTTQAGGEVILTSIDKVNKTITGTFKFKVFRDTDQRSKIITEGVFTRLPYSTTLPPANVTDTFRSTIDNVAWIAKSISATSSGVDLLINGSELDLSKLVGFSLPLSITAGTYNLDFLGGQYIGLYSPAPATFMVSQSGTITVLEHNRVTKRIRANFTFRAQDLVSVKSAQLNNGYLSIVYP